MVTKITKNVVFGVDPQNDFGHPMGNLYCKNGFETVGGGMILTKLASDRNWLLMYSADHHPPNSKHFEKWPPHCVGGTWGAEFLPGIEIPADTPVFLKGKRENEDGYDPFEGIDFLGRSPELAMGNPATTAAIVWGLATNFCVRAFVLTARKKGYKVYVVLDACRPVPTPANPPPNFITEKQAIIDMETAGAIMITIEEVVYGLF